jgi:outer membrane protein assembly factor BamB
MGTIDHGCLSVFDSLGRWRKFEMHVITSTGSPVCLIVSTKGFMERRRKRSRFPFQRLLFAQIVTALLWANFVRAQVPKRTVEDTDSKLAGISIPDAPEAVDLLGKAADEESLKDWNSAADDYLKAIKRFRGRVVPLAAGEGTNGDVSARYVCVGEIVQERLAKWPVDGLSVYTGLYGRVAADQLAVTSRDDAAAVLDIFWSYFATDAGKLAGIRLMDHYFDNGDFRTAAWFGGRLLSFHPNLGDAQPAILYRTSLAWHFAGEDAEAKKLLDELKTMNPAGAFAVGATIAGQDVSLLDALSAALAVAPPPPTTRPWDADEHPSFAEQNDVEANSSTVKPAILAKTIPLNAPNYAGVGPALLKNLLDSDQQEIATHTGSGIIPATDGGNLFFQDGRSLYAIELATGAPIPAWGQTQRNGRFSIDLFGRARDQMLTVTVSPTNVLAIMGQADRSPVLKTGITASTPAAVASSNRLVCLDRGTGRMRWSQAPADLPDPAAHLRSFEYSGTPLVVPANLLGDDSSGDDDSVLVTARGGNESEFDYCYVVCLSCKTGGYRWSTYLGGATRNRDVRQNSGSPSQMALADGRVFVSTNLGLLAAIDPVNGRPIWCNVYGRANRGSAGNILWGEQVDGSEAVVSQHAWSPNPIFVRDGNVFFLPSDTDALFVCDAQSGEPRGSLSMSDWQDANTLLGIQGNGLIVSGDKNIVAVDWQKAVAGRSAQLATLWSADIAFDDDASICGRGVVTSDSVLVPTTHRLVRIVNGRIRATYPARGSFGETQARGNLLVTAEHVLVMGSTQMDIYDGSPMRRGR